MMERLAVLQEKVTLSPTHKILLTTDGSITRILEALTGNSIKVETEIQEIVFADSIIANKLKIPEGDEVNFREVDLLAGEKMLVHATSLTPVARLKPGFKEAIMKKDVPIGKIMEKLNIEARRELVDFDVIKADEKMAERFNIKKGSYLLTREYKIICENEILMNISEVFPYDFFR